MNAKKIEECYSRGTEWASLLESERHATLRYVISEALTMRGQGNMSEYNMNRVTQSLDRYIIDNYPKLRDKELELLINLGIGGELSRDTFVTGAAIMLWIRTFYGCPERTRVVDDDHDRMLERTRPNNGTVLSRNLEAYETKYRQAYEYYQEHWTIFDHTRDKDPRAFSLPHWASMVYQVYLKRGEIATPTAAEIDAAMERAMQYVKEEQQQGWGWLTHDMIQTQIDDLRDAYLLENHYSKTTALLQ